MIRPVDAAVRWLGRRCAAVAAARASDPRWGERGFVNIAGAGIVLLIAGGTYIIIAAGQSLAEEAASQRARERAAGGTLATPATPRFLESPPPGANPTCIQEVINQYYPSMSYGAEGWIDTADQAPEWTAYVEAIPSIDTNWDRGRKEDVLQEGAWKRFIGDSSSWRGRMSVKVAELHRLFSERSCEKAPATGDLRSPAPPEPPPQASLPVAGNYTLDYTSGIGADCPRNTFPVSWSVKVVGADMITVTETYGPPFQNDGGTPIQVNIDPSFYRFSFTYPGQTVTSTSGQFRQLEGGQMTLVGETTRSVSCDVTTTFTGTKS